MNAMMQDAIQIAKRTGGKVGGLPDMREIPKKTRDLMRKTAERRQRVSELKAEGMSCREISAILGVGFETIKNDIRKMRN